MGKLDETADILRQLCLPPRTTGKLGCLTLLALMGLREQDKWESASRKLMTVRKDIMQFMADSYGVEYKENTRESVRKNALRPFLQVHLVERNPDDPQRAVNSANTCYALTETALSLVRRYGSPVWPRKLNEFLAASPMQERIRSQRKIRSGVPLSIAEGVELVLTPGAHNELQAAIIEDFRALFLPHSHLLYVGDASSRDAYRDNAGLDRIGLFLGTQTLLPDVILFDEQENLVCFVEAVTSSGAITDTRLGEFELMLRNHKGTKLYITAFPSFKELKRFMGELAWETEVWLADRPDHLIHFNGDHFLLARRLAEST
jgi:hypothetical protein